LWNFDQDTATTVQDSSSNPQNGTANESELSPIPDLSLSFANGRRFYQGNSLIELGDVAGSKLDLENVDEFTFEAVIRLENVAMNDHIIWNSDQLQIIASQNRIGAFVRQAGGLIGLYTDAFLSVGSNYHLMIVW